MLVELQPPVDWSMLVGDTSTFRLLVFDIPECHLTCLYAFGNVLNEILRFSVILLSFVYCNNILSCEHNRCCKELVANVYVYFKSPILYCLLLIFVVFFRKYSLTHSWTLFLV